jgi:hypothetical protein
MTNASVFEPGATAGSPFTPVQPSPTVIMATAGATYPPQTSAGLETQV